MVQRGADLASNFTSPLAQIYQPLVVDDDIVEHPQDSDTQPIISYGPAMRRRLSSMPRFPTNAPDDNQRKMNVLRSPPGGQLLDDNMVQESPRSTENLLDENDPNASKGGLVSPAPGPASAIVNADKPPTPDSQMNIIMERMSNLEESQKRLEDLILQLSEDLKSRK